MGFLENREIEEYKKESELSAKAVEASMHNFARELKGSLGSEMMEVLKHQNDPPKKIPWWRKIITRFRIALS